VARAAGEVSTKQAEHAGSSSSGSPCRQNWSWVRPLAYLPLKPCADKTFRPARLLAAMVRKSDHRVPVAINYLAVP